MAVIYNFHGTESGLYISLESMTRNGYFPLTVAENNGYFNTTMYDGLEDATGRISSLLKEHTDKSIDDLIEVMEEIKAFFNEPALEVWCDGEGDEVPYILTYEEEEEEEED